MLFLSTIFTNPCLNFSMNTKYIFNYPKYLIIILFNIFIFNSLAQNSKFTLVIDAGHGGHDPGAIGKITREKDINLSVALSLGEMVASNYNDVRVIYTRNNDRYLTLQERADVVNNNHADLFISIHTNSAKATSAYGTESFTLGLAKSKGNLDVAMRENSVILLEDDYKSKYKGFDPTSVESYIMFEFMQDKYLDRSVALASDIQSFFKVHAGRSDRGVRQAGFWVLYRSACPSVLVELGFISNPEEERFLASASGQQSMAESIFKAFKRFKYEYDKKSGKSVKKTDYSGPSTIETENVGRTDDAPANVVTPVKSVVVDNKTAVAQSKDKAAEKQKNLKDSIKAAEKNKSARANSVPEKSTEKPTEKPTDTAVKLEANHTNTTKQSEQIKQDNTKAVEKNQPSEVKKDAVVNEPDLISKTMENSKQESSKLKAEQNSSVAAEKPALSSKSTLPQEKEKYVDLNAYKVATQLPVYKVQLFATAKKLNTNAAEFRGIRNCECIFENGLYKYTVGSDTNYDVILKLRKEMSALFPEAFVVAYIGKNKIAVKDALKLTNKK